MNVDGEQLRASPTLYPLAYDPARDLVGFIELSAVQYAEASFLDQRVAASSGPGRWVPFDVVRDAAVGLGLDVDFVFHVGHVGSTLITRLLGDCPSVFALREPGALRTFAQLARNLDSGAGGLTAPVYSDRVETFLKLWGRNYSPSQRSLIKATSFASEVSELLLGLAPNARAILLTVIPEVHLATILAGPASRVELRQMAASRLDRLHRRLATEVWRLADLSEGETCAMSWAAEMVALIALSDRFADRVLWLDFERVLSDIKDSLRTSLRHLRHSADDALIEQMAASSWLGRYSKAPEHAYDVDLRRRVLDQARLVHDVEIARGRAWLETAADRFPAIARAIGLVGLT